MSESDLSALVAKAGPRHRTATEFVEAALREAILSGELPAGAPLRQEELARAFSVSRMPVREALRQLEAKALVEFHPHRGAVVAEISAADLADICAIRRALESAAIRASIPRLTPEDLDEARDLIAEMDCEGDPGRMGTLNRLFHNRLYARAGYPRLLTLADQHLAAADRYVRFHLAALGREELSQDDHHALLTACARGDAEAAVALTCSHIARAEQHLLAFLREREA